MKSIRGSAMISSTKRDLVEHRKRVERACLRLRIFPFGMENLNAQGDEDAISISMSMVQSAEIFIGIYANRYGYIPDDPRNPDKLSLTELEYLEARRLNKKTLLFVFDDDDLAFTMPAVEQESPESLEKLRRFKDRVMLERVVDRFTSPEDLFGKVLAAIAEEIHNRLLQVDDSQEMNTVKSLPIPVPPLPEMYAMPRYSLVKDFFGRSAELETLNRWSTSRQSVMVVEALGGMGKSALTWEWTTRHAAQAMQPAGIFWWSFYEAGARMESFMRHALAYVTQQDPESLKDLTYEERADQLIDALERRNFLLVMDGLERVLVAYHRLDSAHIRDEQVYDDYDLRSATDPRDDNFLKRLTALHRSKILISTRLMPAEFEDHGRHILDVSHIELKGLDHSGAVDLLRSLGVKKMSDDLVRSFLKDIGYHSLLITIVAGLVRKSPSARGDFDLWYRHEGAQLDLSSMAAHDRRNHILHHSFKNLDEDSRQILCRMAAFSAPIDFDTISIFNHFLPKAPPPPALRKLPMVTPSPFGSPKLAQMRQKVNAASQAERAVLLPTLVQLEEKERQQREWMLQNEARLRRDFERVQAERQQILTEYEVKYRNSPDYINGVKQFDQVLTKLEELGLLGWDRENDLYDLHPVVRGYALSLMPSDERKRVYANIADHFAVIPKYEMSEVREEVDILSLIEFYRATINMGEFEIAAALFSNYLWDLLWRLGSNHLIIELLSPLFTDGRDQFPVVENSRTSITTYMARTLQSVGDVKNARALFSLLLDPKLNGGSWSMSISLNDYAVSMMHFNEIALAARAKQLSVRLIPGDNTAWGWLDQLTFSIDIGDWESADQMYRACLESQPPTTQPDDWSARFKMANALLSMYRDLPNTEAALEEAYTALQKVHNRVRITKLREAEALYRLEKGQVARAQGLVVEAITSAQNTAIPTGLLTAIHGRIYAMYGNQAEAEKLLARAEKDPLKTDGVKADVYLQLAKAYLALGKRDEAKKFALQSYDFAWADGTPYVRWYPLEQSKQVLRDLGEKTPVLMPWDESQTEALPYEDDIVAKFMPDGELLQTSTPKRQEPFEVTTLDWFQVGTIAVFGVDDLAVVELMSNKIASLSFAPTETYYSRMGEPAITPDEIEVVTERRLFSELTWPPAERRWLDKFFLICYLQSKDESGNRNYAYINVRLDRLMSLMEKFAENRPFNLSDHVTLVRVGYGEVDESTREKLVRDYLYGEYFTTVRIFPPLEQALEGGSVNDGDQKPEKFLEMTAFTRLQIGCISTFGLEDMTLVQSLATKLTRLSDQPMPPVYSKMGQPVPECPDQPVPADWTKLEFGQLMLSREEEKNLDKVFIIFIVESRDSSGKPLYAYLNCRGDRIENLIAKGAAGRPFNVHTYSTLITSGDGLPDAETVERLQRDYLFGENGCFNVRIFPPLNEVT